MNALVASVDSTSRRKFPPSIHSRVNDVVINIGHSYSQLNENSWKDRAYTRLERLLPDVFECAEAGAVIGMGVALGTWIAFDAMPGNEGLEGTILFGRIALGILGSVGLGIAHDMAFAKR